MSTGGSAWPSGHAITHGGLGMFNPGTSVLNNVPYTQSKGMTPGMSTRADYDQQLSLFFGQPNSGFNYNAEDDYDKEFDDFPAAFEGKNIRIRKVLISMITATELFPLTAMFPLERQENSMTIDWDIWHFNDHLLNRQPEESVPRILSYKRESGRESFVRYGIGLMLEYGFFKTRMGREAFYMNLQQIRNATVETLAYGAMIAALNHKMYRDANSLYRQTTNRRREDLSKIFNEEIANWALAQKTRAGLEMVETKLSKEMMDRNHGLDGDTIIAPKGMFLPLRYDPARTEHFRSGEKGGIPSEASVKASYFKGKDVYESRGFRLADHEPSDDPNFRQRSIGSYFHMLSNHLRDVDPTQYRTGMIDTYVFSRDKDDYHKYRYRDCVKKAGLYYFNTPGRPATHWGKQYYHNRKYNFRTWGEFMQFADSLDQAVKVVHSWGSDKNKQVDQVAFVRGFAPQFLSEVLPSVISGGGGAVAAAGGGATPPWSRRPSAEVRGPSASAADDVDVLPSSGSDYLGEGKYDEDDDALKKNNKLAMAAFTALLQARAEGNVVNQQRELSVDDHPLARELQTNGGTTRPQALHAQLLKAVQNRRDLVQHLKKSRTSFSETLAEYGGNILEFDIDDAFAGLLKDPDADQTAWERWYLNTAPPSQSEKEAEKQSPVWTFQFHPLLKSALNGVAPVDLPNKALAATLSRKYVVFWQLKKADLDKVRANPRVEFTKDDDLSYSEARHRLIRAQISLTASAILETLLEDKKFEAEKIHRLVVAPNGFDDEYAAEVQTLLEGGKSNVMMTQFRLRRLERPILEIIAHYLKNGPETVPRDVNTLVEDIASYVNQPYEFYAALVHSQVGSGDASFHVDSIQHLVKQSFGQRMTDAEKAAWSDEARQEWIQFGKVLVAENKEQKEVVRSLGGDAVTLYLLMTRSPQYNSFFGRESTYAFRKGYWKATMQFAMTAKAALSVGEYAYFRTMLFSFPISSFNTVDLLKDGDWDTKRGLADEKDAMPALAPAKVGAKLTALQTEYAATRSAPKVQTSLGFRLVKPQGWIDRAAAILEDSNQLTVIQSLQYTALKFAAYLRADSRKWNPILDRVKQVIRNGAATQVVLRDGRDQNNLTEALFEHLVPQLPDWIIEKVNQDARFKPILLWAVVTLMDGSTNGWPAAVHVAHELDQLFVRNALVSEVLSQIRAEAASHPSAAAAAAKASAPQAARVDTSDLPNFRALTRNRIAEIFYLIPIDSGELWQFKIDHNIPQAHGLLGFKPHETCEMGSLVYMNRGRAGRTWYGHADFQIGNDVLRKLIVGNFTLYAKTVVMFNQYIALFPSLFCRAYISGGGHQIWDPLDPQHVEDYNTCDILRDVFFCAVPSNHDPTRYTCMDITGRWASSLCVNEDTQKLTEYFGCEVYASRWGWHHPLRLESELSQSNLPKFNTICFQGKQFLYNAGATFNAAYQKSGGNGDFTLHVRDAGHWGDSNIYPGCTKVLNGHEPFFKNEYTPDPMIVPSSSLGY